MAQTSRSYNPEREGRSQPAMQLTLQIHIFRRQDRFDSEVLIASQRTAIRRAGQFRLLLRHDPPHSPRNVGTVSQCLCADAASVRSGQLPSCRPRPELPPSCLTSDWEDRSPVARAARFQEQCDQWHPSGTLAGQPTCHIATAESKMTPPSPPPSAVELIWLATSVVASNPGMAEGLASSA